MMDLTLEQCDFYIRNYAATFYDKQNKITTTNTEIILDHNDMRFYVVEKSDNSKTLKIVFKRGLHSPYWVIWTPSEGQCEDLISYFSDAYLKVCEVNEKR